MGPMGLSSIAPLGRVLPSGVRPCFSPEDWQEAQARGTARKQQAPWLSVDDKTLQAVEAPRPGRKKWGSGGGWVRGWNPARSGVWSLSTVQSFCSDVSGCSVLRDAAFFPFSAMSRLHGKKDALVLGWLVPEGCTPLKLSAHSGCRRRRSPSSSRNTWDGASSSGEFEPCGSFAVHSSLATVESDSPLISPEVHKPRWVWVGSFHLISTSQDGFGNPESHLACEAPAWSKALPLASSQRKASDCQIRSSLQSVCWNLESPSKHPWSLSRRVRLVSDILHHLFGVRGPPWNKGKVGFILALKQTMLPPLLAACIRNPTPFRCHSIDFAFRAQLLAHGQ